MRDEGARFYSAAGAATIRQPFERPCARRINNRSVMYENATLEELIKIRYALEIASGIIEDL